jgi:plasmid stabilization system protein ParE
MALEIKWSRRADKSFDQILEHLENDWGKTVVKAFVRKVYDFLDILSEFPEIGVMQLPEKGIRGFSLTKQIKVFYKIKTKSIILLVFFDNRQNPLKKRL